MPRISSFVPSRRYFYGNLFISRNCSSCYIFAFVNRCRPASYCMYVYGNLGHLGSADSCRCRTANSATGNGPPAVMAPQNSRSAMDADERTERRLN